MRPANAVICGISVIAGGSLGGRPFDRLGELFTGISSQGFRNMPDWQWRTMLAAFSAMLILAAGNIFNDVRDVACDRVNAPDRPIPSGRVSVRAAAIFAGLLALAGISLSLPLGFEGISIALAAAGVLVWYDISLKGAPLAGNGAVAALGGLAFVYGGIAGYGVVRSLIPAAFAFLFHLGRELIKDGADFEGDRVAGIRTIATVYSPGTAARMGATSLGLLALATLIPWFSGLFGTGYLLVVVCLILPVLTWSIESAVKSPAADNLRRIATVLKIDMPAGILAVLIGFQQL